MESKPRTVYAASSGEYSDYRVHALFEREDDAEAAVANLRDGFTEEFTLYPPGDRSFRLRHYFEAHIEVIDGRIGEPRVYEESDMSATDRQTEVKAHKLPQFSPQSRVNVIAEAATREAAIKGAKDKAAEVAAAMVADANPDGRRG